MAGQYDIYIEQGATYRRSIVWKDGNGDLVDLTGRTARMQIKNSAGEVIASLTDQDGITLGGAAGTIEILFTALQTAAMDFDSATYDLEIVTGADVKRLLRGTVLMVPEVTT